jgi:hypothetical protein
VVVAALVQLVVQEAIQVQVMAVTALHHLFLVPQLLMPVVEVAALIIIMEVLLPEA